tara:strand:+ start:1003 stop:1419 length:417 start_codon:yes stop_codon:yes gene_type:complete
MFDGIIMDDYILEFDIQKAYFLRDCLYEEISYELNESNIIIYKKLENGISSEITLDELIFYIHTEVVESINHHRLGANTWTPEKSFFDLFKKIDNIKKAIENMKIILKYDNESSDEENEVLEEEDREKKKEDNKTLAF